MPWELLANVEAKETTRKRKTETAVPNAVMIVGMVKVDRDKVKPLIVCHEVDEEIVIDDEMTEETIEETAVVEAVGATEEMIEETIVEAAIAMMVTTAATRDDGMRVTTTENSILWKEDEVEVAGAEVVVDEEEAVMVVVNGNAMTMDTDMMKVTATKMTAMAMTMVMAEAMAVVMDEAMVVVVDEAVLVDAVAVEEAEEVAGGEEPKKEEKGAITHRLLVEVTQLQPKAEKVLPTLPDTLLPWFKPTLVDVSVDVGMVAVAFTEEVAVEEAEVVEPMLSA